MRHFNALFPAIVAWDNLLLAWRKARKGKRSLAPAATFEQRAGEHLLALQEALVAAALDGKQETEHLLAADIALTNVRKGVLMAHELGFYNAGQYAHVSALTQEVGNLLGAWRKRADKKAQEKTDA